jgi:hypothetical protein
MFGKKLAFFSKISPMMIFACQDCCNLNKNYKFCGGIILKIVTSFAASLR